MCVVLQERTPLHVAVRSGLGELALEVARSLIDAGADPALLCKGRSTLPVTTQVEVVNELHLYFSR